LDYYLSSQYAPLIENNDSAALNKIRNIIKAEIIIFRACIQECGTKTNKSLDEEFLFGAFDTLGYINEIELHERAGEEGLHAWRTLLSTAGFRNAAQGRPWWISKMRDPVSGICSPSEIKNMMNSLRKTDSIRILKEQLTAHPHGKQVIRDFEKLIIFFDDAADKGQWVIGFEWGT